MEELEDLKREHIGLVSYVKEARDMIKEFEYILEKSIKESYDKGYSDGVELASKRLM